MKSNELKIELLVPLNKRRTKKQKAALQSWIAEALQERLGEMADDYTVDEFTHADRHQVGSMILTSEAGVDEVCV